MQFLFRSLSRPRPLYRHRGYASVTSTEPAAGAFRPTRDRGLDHAVEREKNLRPLINLKDLLKSEPSKSLPISIITQRKHSLEIPVRLIEFIRKYPTVFQEFRPGGLAIHPHVKLTPEVLDLDAEEQLVYQSDSYRQDLADRLLKLLMISRINKIPLGLLDLLKWDLGLPQDFAKTVVPEFPDYFRVIGGRGSGFSSEPDSGSLCHLELVCWSNEHAVSVLEKKARFSKGDSMAFPMNFSKGFEMDKKLKKWLEGWQKLPYISPYENQAQLSPKSDESDKWAAAVLHEMLNLFVAKKAERDNVLLFGGTLGIRSRLKRVILGFPGIFYLSSKLETCTLVLKDGYTRGVLIGRNPVMDIRNRYIHLMHTVKEDGKAASVPGRSTEGEVANGMEEENEMLVAEDDGDYEEEEEEEEEEEDDDDDDDDEIECRIGAHRNAVAERLKTRKSDGNGVVERLKTRKSDGNGVVERLKTRKPDGNGVVERLRTRKWDGNSVVERLKTRKSDGDSVVERLKTRNSDGNAVVGRLKARKPDGNAVVERLKTRRSDGNPVVERLKTRKLDISDRKGKRVTAKHNVSDKSKGQAGSRSPRRAPAT